MGKIAGNCVPALRGGAGCWVLGAAAPGRDFRSPLTALCKSPRHQTSLARPRLPSVGLYRAEGAGLDADGHLRHDEVDLVQSNVPRYEARKQRP